MLKIALCDDNYSEIEQYAELISQIAEKHQVKIQLSTYLNGEALLFHYSETPEHVDIIFLDIMMDKTDGMETARKLRDNNCTAQIVFLTNYENYVYEAFEVNALQYLIKENTSIEKFEKIFLKAAEFASKKDKELFVFEFDGKTYTVPIHQISYFEVRVRIVTVHYNNGKTAKFYDSLEHIEKKLSARDFVRPHRSYLVHLPYITTFMHQTILLKTGEIIPIGGTYVQTLKQTFSDYISRFHVYNPRSINWKEEKP